MSEQKKKELENAMNLQAEAQAAEARGQQMAMEKAGEMTQEIAQDVPKAPRRSINPLKKASWMVTRPSRMGSSVDIKLSKTA